VLVCLSTYHCKEIDEAVGRLAENVECTTAELDEERKVVSLLASHHVGKVGRQHELGSLSLDTILFLVVAEKVACVRAHTHTSHW